MEKITVATEIKAPSPKVWEYFTTPQHITKWNFAADEWHSPSAKIDLRPGGPFSYRMEAKDGSFGFDFEGTFNDVKAPEKLTYTIADGRTTEVLFAGKDGITTVTETFDAEGQNPIEMQKEGWQAILDNFKKYVEGNN